MTGPCTSLTVIGKLQVVVELACVVAVQTSVVVRTGKMEPDRGTHATVPREPKTAGAMPTRKTEPKGGAHATAPKQPTTAGERKLTTALQRLRSLPCVIGAGQASEQACVQHTGSAVRTLRLQPPAMLPMSPPASS